MFVLMIILCIGLLAYGKVQYDQKLSGIAEEANSTMTLATSPKVNNNIQNERGVFNLEAIEGINEEFKEKLQIAIEHNESLRIAIFGSEAMSGSDQIETSSVDIVVKEIENTYPNEMVDIQVFEVGNRTTSEVVNEGLHEDVVHFQPDVLIMEPFILNDNSELIRMNVSLPNITTILADIIAESPEALIILQPPNPVFQPRYYLQQVKELKDFALKNEYMYVDHWEAWPDITDEEINNYVENLRANQKGHEIWASVWKEFFVGEK